MKDRTPFSTARRTPRLVAGAALAACLATAAPLRAATADPEDATGSIPASMATPAPLHRLSAAARGLRLVGETDARDYPVVLTAAEARARAHLHLTYTNAVSVMAEASRLRVLVNDVPVSDTAIAAPTAEDAQSLDIELPTSLLEPGTNAVRIEVRERHRVDCSIRATHELWTQIDPATAGFSFEGLEATSPGDIADLAALPPAEDGTVPLRLVVPKGVEPAALDRLFRTVEAVALRGRFVQAAVDVTAAPEERPGLDIVAGTADELKATGLGDLLPGDGLSVSLRPGAVPGHVTLVVTGETAVDLDAAIASLVPTAAGDVAVGTPAGLRAGALAGGRPVEGGSVVTLRDLGVPSQEFSGRLFHTGFDLLLPPDFYAADYDKMILRIDAGYAAGLLRGNQMLVRVNGRDAAALPLADRDGDVFRARPVAVPLGSLRPGLNHVELEAQLAATADTTCDVTAATAGRKRFVLLDSTSVELPAIARIARMPSLSAMAASGFPYVGRTKASQLYLPHPDADAVSAAATFLVRAALAAGAPLDVTLALGHAADLKGSALVIGAFADIPPAMIDAAGLDATAMQSAWSHVAARSIASARLRDARAAAGRANPNEAGAHEDDDGTTLFRRWSDDVTAGQWRFEPSRIAAQALRKAAGLGLDDLPRWGRGEDHIAVSPDIRLAVAQHEAPGRRGDTWTLLLAPTGNALRTGIRDLTMPEFWNQLDGRVATLGVGADRLAVVKPHTDYFLATAAPSLGNFRLIAAGWLSTEIEVYVLSFVLLAIALGAITATTVRRYGVKP